MMDKPGYGGGGMMDMMSSESDEPLDDFGMAADEALDVSLPPEQRRAALKEAIRLCVEKDEAGEYDEDEKSKGKGGLALIFGAPEKKK